MTLENNHAVSYQEKAQEFDRIKIFDGAFDWLDHDEHWLTSRKSATCPRCTPPTPAQLNQTFTCAPIVHTTATKRREEVEDLIDLNETFEVKYNHTINNSETRHDMQLPQKGPAKLNVTLNGPSRLKPVTMIPKYRFGAHLKGPQ